MNSAIDSAWVRIGENNLIRDLSKYMPPNVVDPATWLKLNAGPDALGNLRKKAQELPEPLRTTWNERLDKPSWRAQINNKTALYKRIEMEGVTTKRSIDQTLQRTMSDVSKEGYTRQMFEIQKGVNMGWAFDLPNTKQADAMARRVLKTQYTQNLTAGQTALLKEQITGGILSGKSVDGIAKQIRENAGGEIWQAKRLVRTEITAAASEGELQAMKDTEEEFGVKMKYRFYATLDERTCPVCGSLDLEEFDPSDAQEGVNKPPMHPNCRCVIQPVPDDDLREKVVRTGRDEGGKNRTMPPGMTYEKWKEQYGKEPRAAKDATIDREQPKFYGEPIASLSFKVTPKMTDGVMTGVNVEKVAGKSTVTEDVKATSWVSQSAENTTETAFTDRTFKVGDIKDKAVREDVKALIGSEEVPLYQEALMPKEIAEKTLSSKNADTYLGLIERTENPPHLPEEANLFVNDYRNLDHLEMNRLVDEVTLPLYTPEARVLIEDYTTGPSKFSKALQGETSRFSSDDLKRIDGLTDLVSQSELKEGIVVYSGIDGRNIYSLNMKPDDIRMINPFQSASTSIGTAYRFAMDNQVPYMEKLLIPPSKGIALPIGYLSAAQKIEDEVLLQRGLRRVFVGTEKSYNGVPVFVFKVI